MKVIGDKRYKIQPCNESQKDMNEKYTLIFKILYYAKNK